MTKTPAWFDARALIAGDLHRDGQITRAECFRIEVDKVLLRDSGPINYKPNNEYWEHMMNDPEYRGRELRNVGLDPDIVRAEGAAFIAKMFERYT